MGRYIIRRLLQALLLLALLSVGMFALIRLLPGGPEQVIFNPRLSAAGRAALRARFGLDQPVIVQYFKWLGNALIGNFGISMPIFLFGLFAQDIFGVSLHWLPTSGTQTLGYTLDPFNAFIDHLEHLILPMLVLSITFIAGWSRYMRSSMIEVTKQDYMRTARAKGVDQVSLLLRHALRNAVIPLITVVAIDFGAVAGGAAITEGIFAWPGMGLLFIDSLETRDYPVLLAMLLLGAVFVIAFNLVADILYAVMDPRIRYS